LLYRIFCLFSELNPCGTLPSFLIWFLFYLILIPQIRKQKLFINLLLVVTQVLLEFRYNFSSTIIETCYLQIFFGLVECFLEYKSHFEILMTLWYHFLYAKILFFTAKQIIFAASALFLIGKQKNVSDRLLIKYHCIRYSFIRLYYQFWQIINAFKILWSIF